MKTQNLIAELFLAVAVLIMIAMFVIPEQYMVAVATIDIMCYIFALRLYVPVKKPAKVISLADDDIEDLLHDLEAQEAEEYTQRQIG
jgi:hypothetical protein